jgi:hypothetical protein
MRRRSPPQTFPEHCLPYVALVVLCAPKKVNILSRCDMIITYASTHASTRKLMQAEIIEMHVDFAVPTVALPK